MIWQTTRFQIDLTRPCVMGIVNSTPDSFSDGGRLGTLHEAARHCERLLADGADILDIGGESSRPGAEPVPADEEWRRIGPLLKLAIEFGRPISVDTTKPEVMRRALDHGVDIVNDIQALRADGALETVAASRAGVCLMHMSGQPRTMQRAPLASDDVVGEVRQFLADRIGALRQRGVDPRRIVVDPGIGFGKTVRQNFELLEQTGRIGSLGYPVLVGWSRKSSLGTVTGRDVDARLSASLAAALAAVESGARIVRVHDVAETVDALKVWAAAGLPAWRKKTEDGAARAAPRTQGAS